MKIVAISDTHGFHSRIPVPDGDVLVHAGDITMSGELNIVRDFNDYLGSLPHPHKIVIAGNHDFCFEQDPARSSALLTNCIYLQDKAVEINGIRFYGSPWQPWFMDWAFNLQRGPEIRTKWEMIPAGTDVLITHGPPAGHGDRTYRNMATGCEDLLDIIGNINPRFHVFGHIHEAYGTTSNGTTTFVNASSCDREYRPANKPVILTV